MMIKRILKKAAVWLGVIGLAASLGLPVWNALADSTPRFNQMSGDEEFLTGRNTADTTGAWSDPVAAGDGEVVEVKVWYHNNASNENGDPGTAAINTRVKVALPTGDATSHIITGSIGADNAATVTGTVVDNVEVGRPGLTINSPLPTALSLVAGSVKWYPNGGTTAVPLPGTQSGDEIISATGLNLGDIQGCWQFSGQVRFMVRLNQAGAPNLIRAKAAFNETQNKPATEVTAKEGDVIRYTLTVRNDGTRPDAAFIVSDDIRDVLAYANLQSVSDGGALQDGFVVYPATAVNAAQTVTRTFKVQIKPAAEWPRTGDFLLTNVYGNQVDVPVLPPVNTPAIAIEKSVKDASGNYVQETEVKVGQIASYRVTLRNTGQVALTNVAIFDLPQNGLEYVKGSATVERDGRSWAVNDDLISAGGLKLNESLGIGQTATVYLQLKVPTSAADGAKLSNIAVVRTDQTTEQRDDALVVAKVDQVVVTPTPVNPGPTLPTTGAGDAGLVMAGLAISGATSLRYWRAKRALARAANSVTVR